MPLRPLCRDTTLIAVASPPRVLRLATVEDLDALLVLEAACFDAERRDTRATIRKSLADVHHETWIESVRSGERIGAAVFLRQTRETLRIYSLATRPDLRGQGWGNHLLAFAHQRARALRCRHVSLEVDATLPHLVAWYERYGYKRVKHLESYYEAGRHAWRMKHDLVLNERASHADGSPPTS